MTLKGCTLFLFGLKEILNIPLNNDLMHGRIFGYEIDIVRKVQRKIAL